MKSHKIIAFLLLFCISCKDKDVEPAKTFDVNDPVGFVFYLEQAGNTTIGPSVYLLEFISTEKVKIHTFVGVQETPFTVVDDNTISVLNTRFTVVNDKISSTNGNYGKIVLLENHSKNQLSGKTFTGTYYRPNNTVLHQNFYYRFKDTNVEVGFLPEEVERTETYRMIGSNAAQTRLANGDQEILVLADGKLHTYYKVNNSGDPYRATYTGTFTP